MKKLLTLALLLCQLTTMAQNNLDEVAEIGNLPGNMPKIKHFASLLFNRAFIGDLQTSSSSRGDATFISFKLKGGEQKITLPATDGMALHFKQKGTSKNPWLAGTGTLSINYKRELLAYSRLPITEFRHGDNLFYFKLGMDIIKLNDAQMIAQILNHFVSYQETGNKFSLLHQQLNTRMKLRMPALTGKIETVSDYLPILNKYLKGDALKQAIFQTYIQGKTQKDTDKHLYQFFSTTSGPLRDEHTTSKLSQLNDPSFALKTETPEQLLIPYKLLKMQPKPADSSLSFQYQYLSANFDLDSRSLQLTFKGSHQIPVPLTHLKVWAFDTKKGADWKPATQLRQKTGASFTQLTLTLSEDLLTLTGKDAAEEAYQIWQAPWPKDFTKTTIKDWK